MVFEVNSIYVGCKTPNYPARKGTIDPVPVTFLPGKAQQVESNMSTETTSATQVDNVNQPCDADRIEQQIYDFIAEKDGSASFANIEQEFGRGNEIDGYGEIGISSLNLVFWEGLTVECADAIAKLLSDKRILLTDVSSIIYIVDGIIPNMPLAKSPPKGGYKKPHWVPTILWTTDQVRARLARGKFDEEYVEKYRSEGYNL